MNTKAFVETTNIDLVQDDILQKSLEESRDHLVSEGLAEKVQEAIVSRKTDLETRKILQTIKEKHEEEKRKKKSAEFSKTRYNVRTPQTMLQLLDLQLQKTGTDFALLQKIATTLAEMKLAQTAFLLFKENDQKFSDLFQNFENALIKEQGIQAKTFLEFYKQKHTERWLKSKIPMWSQETVHENKKEFIEFTWPFFFKTQFLGLALVLIPAKKGAPTASEAREIEVLVSCAQGVYINSSKTNTDQKKEENDNVSKKGPPTGLMGIIAEFMNRIKDLMNNNPQGKS